MGTLNHAFIPFLLLLLNNNHVGVQGFFSTTGNHFGHQLHPSTITNTIIQLSSSSSSSSTYTKLYSEFPKQSGSHLSEGIDIDALVDEVASSNVDNLDSTGLLDNDDEDATEDDEVDEKMAQDIKMMNSAIQLAQSCGGERGSHSPFPKPIVGAVIVTKDGITLGTGRSNYEQHAIQAAIADAGIDATPLSEWCVTWPRDSELRENLRDSTLYVTLEPSAERQG